MCSVGFFFVQHAAHPEIYAEWVVGSVRCL